MTLPQTIPDVDFLLAMESEELAEYVLRFARKHKADKLSSVIFKTHSSTSMGHMIQINTVWNVGTQFRLPSLKRGPG